MVKLAGTPEEIGACWGSINAEAIQYDIEAYFLTPSAGEGISRDELLSRSERFVEIVDRLSPHWLVEAQAIANQAGVDSELYISFIANVYRELFLHPECTSYAVHREYTQDRAILFHKTRDNKDRSQCAFIMDQIGDLYRFIAVSDSSVPACMMMVNEKGLAGSADTGGLEVDEPKYRGVMNAHILRYVAERAASCTEALEIVTDFVRGGRYAGAGKTGTHWLFVDSNGVILEISHNSSNIEHAYHTEKVYFSARGDTSAARVLEEANEPVDFRLFHEVSRDRSIRFDSSISGMTVEIDPDHPERDTRAWIALPAGSISVPLFMGQRKTPLPLLNGRTYGLGHNMLPTGDADGEKQSDVLEKIVESERQLYREVSGEAGEGDLDSISCRAAAAVIEALS